MSDIVKQGDDSAESNKKQKERDLLNALDELDAALEERLKNNESTVIGKTSISIDCENKTQSSFLGDEVMNKEIDSKQTSVGEPCRCSKTGKCTFVALGKVTDDEKEERTILLELALPFLLGQFQMVILNKICDADLPDYLVNEYDASINHTKQSYLEFIQSRDGIDRKLKHTKPLKWMDWNTCGGYHAWFDEVTKHMVSLMSENLFTFYPPHDRMFDYVSQQTSLVEPRYDMQTRMPTDRFGTFKLVQCQLKQTVAEQAEKYVKNGFCRRRLPNLDDFMLEEWNNCTEKYVIYLRLLCKLAVDESKISKDGSSYFESRRKAFEIKNRFTLIQKFSIPPAIQSLLHARVTSKHLWGEDLGVKNRNEFK